MADTTRYRDDSIIEKARHDRDGSPLIPGPTANSFFRRPLRITTGITLVLTVFTIGLTITNCVLLSVWDFEYVRAHVEVNRDLSIVLFVMAILLIRTIFVELPILVNVIIHIFMATQIISFSANFFERAFTNDDTMCRRLIYNPVNHHIHHSKSTQSCHENVEIVSILMSIAGGLGLFIGDLVIALTILRLVAIFKSQFWKNKRVAAIFSPNVFSNFTGVTMQLSFSILPSDTLPVVIDTQSMSVVGTIDKPEAETLIET